MYRIYLLSLWAYAGLLVAYNSMTSNLPLMLGNAMYMMLWAWVLQNLYGKKEQIR
ncbi:hypothetical protein [Cytobacillus praedii]|uniref:hypothetical protein n=1 Tax=Cytobacillus praedii TaxID=1742358 RepID=UPI002E1B5517|nr:hypothetical protein [Cytobacillus praedii]